MVLKNIKALLLFFALLHCSSAQSLPDAGSIRQQMEQNRPLSMPAAPAKSTDKLPSADSAAPMGASAYVRSFQFTGNSLLSSEALAKTLSGFSDQFLDFAGLQRAANAVAAAYREAGWTVRVLLPEQDISSGVVLFQIMEARFGGVRFEGKPPERVMPSEIEAYFYAHQAPQQLIRSSAIDRALLLTNDLPGVRVTGTQAPGARDGESDLVLHASDEAGVQGDVSMDNAGARSTGSRRTLANLNINSPGLRGEVLSLNLLLSAGSEYARVALTVPANHHGLRAGVSRTFMTYKVIDGPGHNSTTPIQGSSGSLGMDMTYPLLRTRDRNLFLSSTLENKTFYTQDSAVRSDYATNSLRLGLAGNAFDAFGAGGSTHASLQMLWGQLTDLQAHNLINTIDRRYQKVNLSLSRQQSLGARHALMANFSGQWANRVLDSSEKLYLGGAQSVRAYPASELSGDRGHLLTLEWRWSPFASTTFSAFTDTGRAVTLPALSAENRKNLHLAGHGLSAIWRSPGGLETRLTWSRRQGANPQPTSTGTDSDGTLTLNRLWLSASLGF